jgi:hypothetical protein
VDAIGKLLFFLLIEEKDRKGDAHSLLYFVEKQMCRHEYGASWEHSREHCPNLVPNAADLEKYPSLRNMSAVPVKIAYAEFERRHDSLVGFWNDWYNQYLAVSWPRLIVRYVVRSLYIYMARRDNLCLERRLTLSLPSCTASRTWYFTQKR